MLLCAVPGSAVRITIVPPHRPEGFVRRDRLRSLLDAAVAAAGVTLVRAEPGQGRTVMLADWARTGTNAWVSTDRAVRRPDEFWTAVAAAIARCVPRLATDLSRPFERSADRAIVAGDVLSVLDRLPHEVRLVLDDVHGLIDPVALDELRTLVRYRPTRLRLVLSSRTEPPLSLARLRLQGDLVDIHGDALSFSPEETAAFVGRSVLSVRADEIERLHDLTGGWASAVRLVTDAAVAGSSGLAGVLAVLAGEDGSAAGHLARAMLGRLTRTDRSFMGAMSVADPVPTDLALELSGVEDAAHVLARLRDLGLVTDGPLPGHHTLQPLLRRHLRTELARRDPARVVAWHGRAARWFAGADRPARALQHALRADDPVLIADLVREWAVPLVLTGHHDDLRAGLRRLRPPALARDPRLRAAAALLDPDPSPLAGGAGDPNGEVATLRTLRDRINAAGPHPPDRPDVPGADRARRAGGEALDAAHEGARRLLLRDDPRAARLDLEEALSRSDEWGWSYLAMRCAAVLASADLVDGDTAAMALHASAALAAAEDGGCDHAVSAVSAHAVLAYASLLQARPDDARRHAADGLEAAGQASHPAVRLQLHALHGAAETDGGRPADGLEEIQRARAAFSDRPLAGPEATLVATLEHEMALGAGRAEHARAVRRWITGRVGTTGDVLLMTARADPVAGPSLRGLFDGSVPALLAQSEIEARLRPIGAGQVVADPAGARRSLEGALDRAVPLGLVRPFAHSPGPVRILMAHQVGTFGATDDFVRRALAAPPPGRRAAPVDALSAREAAILRLLPSLATMTEIARDLGVSVNTVKTQVGAIYAKLGVADRRGAVVAAYDTGLLRAPGHHDPPWGAAPSPAFGRRRSRADAPSVLSPDR